MADWKKLFFLLAEAVKAEFVMDWEENDHPRDDSGKFASGGGGSKSSGGSQGENGIIKLGEGRNQIDLQLFSERDIQKQKTSSLKKGIKSYKKVISEHEDKIKNPEKYYPGWTQKRPQEQQSNIRHWKHEIEVAKQSMRDREEELKKRGEKND